MCSEAFLACCEAKLKIPRPLRPIHSLKQYYRSVEETRPKKSYFLKYDMPRKRISLNLAQVALPLQVEISQPHPNLVAFLR